MSWLNRKIEAETKHRFSGDHATVVRRVVEAGARLISDEARERDWHFKHPANGRTVVRIRLRGERELSIVGKSKIKKDKGIKHRTDDPKRIRLWGRDVNRVLEQRITKCQNQGFAQIYFKRKLRMIYRLEHCLICIDRQVTVDGFKLPGVYLEIEAIYHRTAESDISAVERKLGLSADDRLNMSYRRLVQTLHRSSDVAVA